MAVRIAGVNLPNKRLEVALTYVFGVGHTTSLKILEQEKLDKNKRPSDLTDEEVNNLRKNIESGKITIEGDLRREVSGNIKRLKEIGCYRGVRHTKGLPARGQRTKTNNRTVRGNTRTTAVSGKINAAQKT